MCAIYIHILLTYLLTSLCPVHTGNTDVTQLSTCICVTAVNWALRVHYIKIITSVGVIFWGLIDGGVDIFMLYLTSVADRGVNCRSCLDGGFVLRWTRQSWMSMVAILNHLRHSYYVSYTVICTRNRVPRPGSKSGQLVPVFCTGCCWNWWKSHSLIVAKFSTTKEIQLSHFRWRTI